MKNVCVIGLGCMGLPTACLLAARGHSVLGVDNNEEVVRAVNRGKMLFDEPGMPELLKEAAGSGRLRAATAPADADVFIIAVPTPLRPADKTADLSCVLSACDGIARFMRRDRLVVIESTLPVGTVDRVIAPRLGEAHLCYCPERAIPGSTLREMANNDRLIGGIDAESAELARQVYASFVSGTLHLTDARTAEASKLMENAFRDVNIALANEFAGVAEEMGIDVWKAIKLANKHPRVNILSPGPGVGGYCLTKDPLFLVQGRGCGELIRTARKVNDSMPARVAARVVSLLGTTRERTVTVLGVSYKADVGDSRFSPALDFVRLAAESGLQVRCHDPLVRDFPRELLGLEEAAQGSDCLVLITDHAQFRSIDPRRISPLMRSRNLLDCRNWLDRELWSAAGFRVASLGAGSE